MELRRNWSSRGRLMRCVGATIAAGGARSCCISALSGGTFGSTDLCFAGRPCRADPLASCFGSATWPESIFCRNALDYLREKWTPDVPRHWVLSVYLAVSAGPLRDISFRHVGAGHKRTGLGLYAPFRRISPLRRGINTRVLMDSALSSQKRQDQNSTTLRGSVGEARSPHCSCQALGYAAAGTRHINEAGRLVRQLRIPFIPPPTMRAWVVAFSEG